MRVWIFCILALCILPAAFAFQVSPAALTQTTPETTHTFTVRVDSPGFVDVAFEGELAPYARAERQYVERSAAIPVTVAVPELTPGDYELFVIFKKQVSSGEVGVAAELAPKITYRVFFDGPYLTTEITPRNETSPFEIVAITHNYGLEQGSTLLSAQIADVRTEQEIVVAPKEVQRTDLLLESPKGEYLLTVSADEDIILSKFVRVGAPTISLVSVKTTYGEIAAIDLELASDWNVPFTTAVRGTIKNQSTWVLAPQTVSFPDGEVTLFWENPALGTYDLVLFVGDAELFIPIEFTEELTKTQWFGLAFVMLLVVILLQLLLKNKERFK